MACNKCKSESCTCINTSCTPIDASCVIYNLDGSPSNLNCIDDIQPNTNLKSILERWDDYFCGLSNVTIITCVKEKLNIPASTQTLPTASLLTYIQNWICNYQDVNVKVTPADTSTGYLNNKIETGDCIVTSVTIDGDGNQKLKFSLDFPCLASKLPLCFNIQTNDCITMDCAGCQSQCTPQPLTPIITKFNNTLTGTNCNGMLQWYNTNNQLVGTGSTIEVAPNVSYYAKCTTSCGDSVPSNVLAVPPITTYTKTRVALFTKACGVNECNVGCVGSSVTFTKTYTSTISQEAVNSLAENDLSFSVDGQAYVNLVGTCTCSDCTCVFPVYNPNVVVNNATCLGNVINANGQITISGISKADKFGYSIGSGEYAGIGYASAFTLNNFNQGNVETTSATIKLKSLSIETRVVFRIFNHSDTCYKDVVVNLTPPDCTQEHVEIDSISVTCEIEEVECKNWTIVAGSTGAKIWYQVCNSNTYQYNEVLSNTTVNRCSPLQPQVVGGVVSENGLCQ